jgi:hypothetical protein
MAPVKKSVMAVRVKWSLSTSSAIVDAAVGRTGIVVNAAATQLKPE